MKQPQVIHLEMVGSPHDPESRLVVYRDMGRRNLCHKCYTWPDLEYCNSTKCRNVAYYLTPVDTGFRMKEKAK